jgi:hypothetical protein
MAGVVVGLMKGYPEAWYVRWEDGETRPAYAENFEVIQ